MDAILLAAGNSRRFFGNKLLYPIQGKEMYRWMLERLCDLQDCGRLDHIILVTQYEEILDYVRGARPQVIAVTNSEAQKGISTSIYKGLMKLQEISPDSEGCLFAVADQPWFTEASLEELIACHHGGITMACGEVIRGNPVIFSSKYYAQLLQLKGDVGGKQVWRRYPNEICCCKVTEDELEDVDTREKNLLYTLPFVREKGHVISIVGAGGKTSLLYALADCYAGQGYRVVLTTTTRIQSPPEGYPVCEKEAQIRRLLDGGRIVVVGAPAEGNKIRQSERVDMARLQALADVVLIEADGSKHLPCKVPAEHEPVLCPESDLVIAVMGMHAAGHPLSEVCFRKDEAMRLLDLQDEAHRLSAQDMAKILLSENGSRKAVNERRYYIILNRCDTLKRQSAAEEVRRLVMSQAQNGKDVDEVLCLNLPLP